jgi:hypothetical protein
LGAFASIRAIVVKRGLHMIGRTPPALRTGVDSFVCFDMKRRRCLFR